MPLYLATKEMLRNKARFLAVVLIVALITLLVLFTAAFGDGLALAGKQYLENIDAQLILFQEDVDISIPASQLNRAKLNNVKRVEGVEDVGPIGFAVASIVLGDGETEDKIDVSLIGVEPGKPGAPIVFDGVELRSRRANEVILGQNVLDKADIPIGSYIDLKVTQGGEEEIYSLKVIGHTKGQQYFFLPSVFVPLLTWDRIMSEFNPDVSESDIGFNIAAVKLKNPDTWPEMIETIERNVNGVELTDPVTTYQATQGFSDMQAVIDAQQRFVLLIVMLVIGSFFQIQTLQKVAQIGMLKAIGASNWLIAATLLVQVMLTTVIGVAVGGLACSVIASMLPPGIPATFDGQKVVIAVIMLLVSGPLTGLVSLRTLLKVEPLTALGLGA
jgi:putative ABC transport system permease protein